MLEYRTPQVGRQVDFTVAAVAEDDVNNEVMEDLDLGHRRSGFGNGLGSVAPKASSRKA